MTDEPPRCIIDLGAHIGFATLCFKAQFPDTEVHCYEPDPENFLCCQVRWIVGELKARQPEIEKFVALFPSHDAHLYWQMPKMGYVDLRRE